MKSALKTVAGVVAFLVLSRTLLLQPGNCWAAAVVIDHTCTDIHLVPTNWVSQAKQRLHIAYGHTSHGTQLTDGMTGLVPFMTGQGYPSNLYAWNNGGSGDALDLRDTPFSPPGDLGTPDWVTWAGTTRNYLNAHPECNVVIWAWCGAVSFATEENINTYLNLMGGLDQDYTNVTFVYMTGHLDGSGAAGNLNVRNNQIRNHCLARGKVLYDFADIESYDPDGQRNYMPLIANDNCDYDSDANNSRDRNWAVDWQNLHTEGVDWYACAAAHSQPLNANRKAYAAWWLWARLAGWPGTNMPGQVYITRLENSIGEVEDSFISANYPHTNFGSAEAFHPLNRFLIKFNLPPALANKRIVEARVAFFVFGQGYYQTNQYLDLYRVLRPWQENEVTWSRATATQTWQTAGGDYDTNRVGRILHQEGRANWDYTFYPPLDVTPLVQKWASGVLDNHGLLLVNASATEIGTMASEYPPAQQHPYLEIKYANEPGPYFFEQWQQDHFTAAELANPALEATLWGRWADPDGDTLPNIFEYALGEDPRSPGRAGPMIHADIDANQQPLLTYQRAWDTQGVRFELQSSQTLDSWSLVPAQMVSNRVEAVTSGLERVTIQFQGPPPGSTAFYRLRLTAE